MTMRKVLATLLVTLLTSTAVAQTPAKPARIGKLCPAKCDGLAHIIFEEEMRKLGWIEGKNLITERKEADGRFEHLPELAAQLVRQRGLGEGLPRLSPEEGYLPSFRVGAGQADLAALQKSVSPVLRERLRARSNRATRSQPGRSMKA